MRKAAGGRRPDPYIADRTGSRFLLPCRLPPPPVRLFRRASMTFDPRHRSRHLLDGRDRAPARSMLKAIGFDDAALAKPIIGVANTWIETMPCNYHLRELAVHVKEGIRAAGGTPMEFNTIAISE